MSVKTSIAREARQARSGDTERRIAAAARAILRKKLFHEVKMADIADRAGVSIGGLYARFPSKEALGLYLVDRGVFDVLAKEIAKVSDDAHATAGDVMRRYLQTVAALYRRHRSVLRAMFLATRTGRGSDEKHRRYVRNFNLGMHERLRTAVMARCPSATEESVRLAILSAWVTLREVVLFGQPVSDLAPMDEATLIEEILRQFRACTGCGMSKSKRGKR